MSKCSKYGENLHFDEWLDENYINLATYYCKAVACLEFERWSFELWEEEEGQKEADSEYNTYGTVKGRKL